MNAPTPDATDAVLDRVLAGSEPYAHVRSALTAMHDAAWAATDPVVLRRCEERIAELLRSGPASGSETSPDRPSPLEDACLAFTDQYVLDVAAVEPAQLDAIRVHLGDAGTLDFVRALLVVEQRIRLRLAFSRLFAEAS
jgi:hypothetical protein